MIFAVYDLSHMVCCVEAPTPREAWHTARAVVRLRAHVEGPEVIGQTANRAFVQRGAYRALPVFPAGGLRG